MAHPRSRGENIRHPPGPESPVGSSPLTRGKRCRMTQAAAELRLIPAHAGKTSRLTVRAATCAAHPRSRGENPTGGWSLVPLRGSSPLTRGKPTRRPLSPLGPRLIPAHAGKTRYAHAHWRQRAAHPRSRGENWSPETIDAWLAGSSPLTRGKRQAPRAARPTGGLIPAHAGKTSSTSCTGSAFAAHPRSRGENPFLVFTRVNLVGSSPLTRGKLFSRSLMRSGSGLIPAHAGKTPRLPCRRVR